MHQIPDSRIYQLMMLLALVVSFLFWLKRAKQDKRLYAVYLGGLLGGFAGAKLLYILAEGWLHFGEPTVWIALATGKSIVGALLGGYAGIEIAKKSVGYEKPTGDWFALVVPIGIAMGRIGCLSAGCCLGVESETASWWTIQGINQQPRWPSSAVELAFNLLMVVILLPIHQSKRFPGQLFHLYLITYGLFRFGHEFLRATEKPFAGLSGYQIAALGLVTLGIWRFWQRWQK